MEASKKLTRFVAWPVVILGQLIGTQIVTFLFSLLLGDFESLPQKKPVLFLAFLGFTYAIGISLVGWLAIKLHWLKLEPNFLMRFAGTLVGAYLLLALGLVLYEGIIQDNPFIIIASPLAGILGFYLGGWAKKQ